MVDPSMAQGGWPGGQGVTWVDSPDDTFLCTYSDGTYGGFLLWGSSESSDQYTASTGNQAIYRYGLVATGSWILYTSSFEKYSWLSRQGPGPLVPLVYQVGDRLTFSLRGYWSNSEEWTPAGDPRAPNTYYIGYVFEVPSAANNYYLGIQTSI